MEKMFKIAVVLGAIDKMSGVIDSGVTKSQKKLQKLSRTAKNVAAGSFAAGAVMAAPLLYAGNAAVQFEDKMADVGKVLNAVTGSEELNRIGDSVKHLSVYLGTAPDDIAALYENLAVGGVVQEELGDVAKIAGEVGVAFGITADAAGTAFPKIRNALGTNIDQTALLMDAVNHLGNTVAAKAPEILEFLTAGGASGAATLNVAGKTASAFGASFIAMGKSASEAGTIYSRFSKAIAQNADLNKIFTGAGGGEKGLMAILNAGMKLQGLQRASFFQQFGQYGVDIQLLAQRMNGPGGLLFALNQVSDATKYAGSSQAEFLARMSTTASKLKRAQAQLNILTIELGENLLPIIVELLQKINPVLESFRDFAKENPKLVSTIIKVSAAGSALLFVVGWIATAVWAVTTAWGAAVTVAGFLSPAIGALTTAFMGLNSVLLLNPIIAIAAAVVAAIASIAALVVYWDDFMAWFGGQSKVVQFIVASILWPFTVIAGAIKALIKVFQGDLSGAWDVLAETFLSTPLGIFLDAGENIVKTIGEGIKSGAVWVTDAISSVTEAARQYLPFSPAKQGAFKDLHKVRIIETIADAIVPDPLVNAIGTVTSAVFPQLNTLVSPVGPAPAISPMGGGGVSGGGVTISYAPNITIGAGADEQTVDSFKQLLKEHSKDLLRILNQEQERKNRRKF